MIPPLGRLLMCPDCQHDHLHLPCDVCGCTAVTVPGIYPRQTEEAT